MLYLGIDLGGTTIKAGIVDEEGKILHKASCVTELDRGCEAVFGDVAALAFRTLRDGACTMEEIASVGVGFPGIWDTEHNCVPYCSNLKWPDRFPLTEYLGNLLGKTVYAGNDASAAALAEAAAGASLGTRNSVLVTLGTGVGGGVILNGKLFSGSHGVTTEIGHMITVSGGELCTCGNRGCFECYASATALIREGCRLCEDKPDCALMQSVDGDLKQIEARTVIDLAKVGDPDCLELFEQYTERISEGLVSLINVYDPEVIVIGGGVSHAGAFLLEPLRQKTADKVYVKNMPFARIELAMLGNDAGIIGAAMLGRAL